MQPTIKVLHAPFALLDILILLALLAILIISKQVRPAHPALVSMLNAKLALLFRSVLSAHWATKFLLVMCAQLDIIIQEEEPFNALNVLHLCLIACNALIARPALFALLGGLRLHSVLLVQPATLVQAVKIVKLDII